MCVCRQFLPTSSHCLQSHPKNGMEITDQNRGRQKGEGDQVMLHFSSRVLCGDPDVLECCTWLCFDLLWLFFFFLCLAAVFDSFYVCAVGIQFHATRNGSLHTVGEGGTNRWRYRRVGASWKFIKYELFLVQNDNRSPRSTVACVGSSYRVRAVRSYRSCRCRPRVAPFSERSIV